MGWSTTPHEGLVAPTVQESKKAARRRAILHLGDTSRRAPHPWAPKRVAEVEAPGLLLDLSPTLWRMSYREVWGALGFLAPGSAGSTATQQGGSARAGQ